MIRRPGAPARSDRSVRGTGKVWKPLLNADRTRERAIAMPMRILVDNGTYALENMGDVIMLQCCVARLRAMWPDASIGVFTRRPERLRKFCPDAEPVNALGRDLFVCPGSLLGKLHRVAPGVEGVLRRSAPTFSAVVARARLRR